jgi:hypothetical protein
MAKPIFESHMKGVTWTDTGIFWTYKVVIKGYSPTIGTIRAATKTQAKQFLKARHQEAVVIEVTGKADSSWMVAA